MTDDARINKSVVNDEQRELWKAQNHLSDLYQILSRLEDEPFSMKYVKEFARAKKHALLASKRLGEMVGRKVDLAARLELAYGPMVDNANG